MKILYKTKIRELSVTVSYTMQFNNIQQSQHLLFFVLFFCLPFHFLLGERILLLPGISFIFLLNSDHVMAISLWTSALPTECEMLPKHCNRLELRQSRPDCVLVDKISLYLFWKIFCVKQEQTAEMLLRYQQMFEKQTQTHKHKYIICLTGLSNHQVIIGAREVHHVKMHQRYHSKAVSKLKSPLLQQLTMHSACT